MTFFNRGLTDFFDALLPPEISENSEYNKFRDEIAAEILALQDLGIKPLVFITPHYQRHHTRVSCGYIMGSSEFLCDVQYPGPQRLRLPHFDKGLKQVCLEAPRSLLAENIIHALRDLDFMNPIQILLISN